MIENVSSAPGIEYIAVTLSVPSQQFPPACTTTTDNFGTTDLVHPQFSFPAVQAFSPQVVGSPPPLDEFDAPVYNRIHQEQFVAGETTQNTFENPVVQEQVVVQEIPQAPQVVDSFPLLGDVAAHECNEVFQPPVIFSRNSRGSGCGADTGFTDGTHYELHVDQQRCACRDTCRDRSCYHR